MTTATELKVLIAEDSEDDLFLLLKALKAGGFKPAYKRVQTPGDFEDALKNDQWQVVISDYSMPKFSGIEAAKIIKKNNVRIPFFIVSGTIGEETAVEVMKAGAQDYVMKENLTRLIPAIQRELREFEKTEKMQHDLKLKEDQLRQAQKMEAIGRLAGGIAHDFNNLLGVMMLASENAQRKLTEAHPAWVDIDQIQMATERAAALTRQLLTFSRKQVTEPKPLEVNPMVNHLQKLLSRILGEDIQFEVELKDSLPKVQMDPSHFEQVMMNLIVNARDAMPEGGKLTVRTELVTVNTPGDTKAGDYVALYVSDTGCGMDEKTKEHIFEPFFTTKGPDKGTGLGLANVFGIVQQANGHISVKSTPGQGATFCILLPALHSAPVTTTVTQRTTPSLEGHETILLVEDQDELRLVIETALKKYKYNIISSESSLEAIRQAELYDKPIDLLISDLIMPDLNGFELAIHLSEKRRDMKTLIMSGYLDDRLLASAAGHQKNFIHKPFSSEELLKKIRQVLDRN